ALEFPRLLRSLRRKPIPPRMRPYHLHQPVPIAGDRLLLHFITEAVVTPHHGHLEPGMRFPVQQHPERGVLAMHQVVRMRDELEFHTLARGLYRRDPAARDERLHPADPAGNLRLLEWCQVPLPDFSRSS